MKTLCHIVGFVVLLLCAYCAEEANAAGNQTLWIEVPNGNTSFLYQSQSKNLWWINETCKVKLSAQEIDKTILKSEKLSKNVKIGNQSVKIVQQFKIDLEARDKLEIYSSIRGGWFAIPINVHETCLGKANCQSLLGRPTCPS